MAPLVCMLELKAGNDDTTRLPSKPTAALDGKRTFDMAPHGITLQRTEIDT